MPGVPGPKGDPPCSPPLNLINDHLASCLTHLPAQRRRDQSALRPKGANFGSQQEVCAVARRGEGWGQGSGVVGVQDARQVGQRRECITARRTSPCDCPRNHPQGSRGRDAKEHLTLQLMQFGVYQHRFRGNERRFGEMRFWGNERRRRGACAGGEMRGSSHVPVLCAQTHASVWVWDVHTSASLHTPASVRAGGV